MEMKVKLCKLSLCPCGFPLLNEAIPLGMEYTMLTETCDLGQCWNLICGNCGAVMHGHGSVMVNAHLNPGAEYARLPVAIFDFGIKGAG